MPIEKIVPDATTTSHPTWTEIGGGTGNVNLALDADDGNYARCTTVTNKFIVTFGDLTVALGSINSIRFYVNGFDSGVRGGSDVVTFDLLNASDSSYSLAENKTFTDITINTVQAGTERTTSDGSAAWTEAFVNGLRMKVTWVTENNANCILNLDHLYIDVDYNEPLADTYNTNDSKIHVGAGTLYVQSGTIYIN
jgi:hypothetical protein|tara:strand:- start:1416 stop:2000 length:585 start_codon:yes stop_codon:yes gene_type:complete